MASHSLWSIVIDPLKLTWIEENLKSFTTKLFLIPASHWVYLEESYYYHRYPLHYYLSESSAFDLYYCKVTDW